MISFWDSSGLDNLLEVFSVVGLIINKHNVQSNSITWRNCCHYHMKFVEIFAGFRKGYYLFSCMLMWYNGKFLKENKNSLFLKSVSVLDWFLTLKMRNYIPYTILFTHQINARNKKKIYKLSITCDYNFAFKCLWVQ